MLKHWHKPAVLALIGTFVVLYDDGINIVLGKLPEPSLTYMATSTASSNATAVFAPASILEPRPPNLQSWIKRPNKSQS